MSEDPTKVTMDRVAPMVSDHSWQCIQADRDVTVSRCTMCLATTTVRVIRSWSAQPDVTCTTIYSGPRICPSGLFHNQQRRIN